MDYIILLLNLFVLLFNAAVQFKFLIPLVICSGVFGGLVSLFKSLLKHSKEYIDE